MFDEDDAESIRMAKEMFGVRRIKNDLAYIKTHFAGISTSITKLQKQGLPLNEGIGIIESTRASLNSLGRKEFVQKMDAVLRRNGGFESLVEIRNVLFNSTDSTDEYVQKLTPDQLAMFRYCPVTSADVERSFSTYGSFLTEKRRAFGFENLKQHVIIHCNRKNDRE